MALSWFLQITMLNKSTSRIQDTHTLSMWLNNIYYLARLSPHKVALLQCSWYTSLWCHVSLKVINGNIPWKYEEVPMNTFWEIVWINLYLLSSSFLKIVKIYASVRLKDSEANYINYARSRFNVRTTFPQSVKKQQIMLYVVFFWQRSYSPCGHTDRQTNRWMDRYH